MPTIINVYIQISGYMNFMKPENVPIPQGIFNVKYEGSSLVVGG